MEANSSEGWTVFPRQLPAAFTHTNNILLLKDRPDQPSFTTQRQPTVLLNLDHMSLCPHSGIKYCRSVQWFHRAELWWTLTDKCMQLVKCLTFEATVRSRESKMRQVTKLGDVLAVQFVEPCFTEWAETPPPSFAHFLWTELATTKGSHCATYKLSLSTRTQHHLFCQDMWIHFSVLLFDVTEHLLSIGCSFKIMLVLQYSLSLQWSGTLHTGLWWRCGMCLNHKCIVRCEYRHPR